MPGQYCAFSRCSTSRKHGIGLFKLPCPRADESEEITRLKTNASESWLNLILRTRNRGDICLRMRQKDSVWSTRNIVEYATKYQLI